MHTATSVHLTIPDVPVSNNVLLRMHWAKRARYNDSWAWQVRKAMGYPCIFEAPPVKASVYITQHRQRLLDTDNLYGSVKPLVDALREWQLIYDDSPDHCELTVKQEKSKTVYTDIVVEVIGSEDAA